MSNVKKIVLGGYYDVVVENDHEKEKTSFGIDNWNLGFYKKNEVEGLIQQLTKALEFWEFDEKPANGSAGGKQPKEAKK